MRYWRWLFLLLAGVGGYFWYAQSSREAVGDLDAVGGAAPEPGALEEQLLSQHRVAQIPYGKSAPVVVAREDLPRRWSDLNDEAIAALASGELERAVQLFEQCQEGLPEQEVFAKNLAEALARLARHQVKDDFALLDEGIAQLERALELDPSRDDLRDLLQRWKASLETEADFWTDETAHFSLSYDGDRTELLKFGYSELTRLLETVYGEYGLQLNHYPVGTGDPKIRVLLYDRDQFTRITGVGHWAGGVFDGTVRIPVADYARERREIERVLRHELVHAFLRSYGGKDVPAWLNEGLAQRWESGSINARVQRARDELAGQELFDLTQLEPSFTAISDETRIPVAYSQSMVLVEHLYRWYGQVLVFELIRGCSAGRPPAQTFRSRTGLDLESVAADAFKP